MRLIVQKFGGSSLNSPELRKEAVGHILAARKEGFDPVVVVSAMGRRGEPYATDTLLDLLRSADPLAPPRESDIIASCGEIIAAAVIASQICAAGLKAVSLAGWQAGIITDGVYGQAEITRIKKERILKLVSDGTVVVVAGFQGVSEHGEINTLGRGGSDTTAVALAAALESEAVEIYSDVDTVMTADPRLVPEARPIRDIGYQEILQMASEGARVIHPRAVDIAIQYNLPLILRKTGQQGSTRVTHRQVRDEKVLIPKTRVASGITHVTGLAQVRLENPETGGKEMEEALRNLAAEGVSIDLISFSPREKMFTVPAGDGERVKASFSAVGCRAVVQNGFAKVSVVGSGMRGVPGVMARVVRALNRAGTEILQTADSLLSISCLIREKDVSAAVQSLHLEFGLGDSGQ
jgi:aspartate kinase